VIAKAVPLYELTTISPSTESGITADRTLPLLSRYTHSMIAANFSVIGGRYRCNTGKLGHGRSQQTRYHVTGKRLRMICDMARWEVTATFETRRIGFGITVVLRGYMQDVICGIDRLVQLVRRPKSNLPICSDHLPRISQQH
jgi:hypothetical protein